ncbi:hypothetical protein Theba_1142 [Mesotoga prima MesG1.Ag.4.2]|uniref:Uncharacterized protein n=1 Tax=Mesotoga prima MesG1.Ag.4.2 TaxID=660470 RepID=I2F4J1_9BACT|nr:hypothetical protein Theba_1142 [Mesotoga prima MesG1.Ag.4.2]
MTVGIYWMKQHVFAAGYSRLMSSDVLLVRIPSFREKGTDHRNRSVPIFAYSDQWLLNVCRSLCRDPVQDHYGMTPLNVILTMVLEKFIFITK